MPQEIRVIQSGFVNAYLLNTGAGFMLIDTGMAGQRAALERELQSAGCQPGTLKLIVITHGDMDHCGSAAYLQKKYGTKIALHRSEEAIVASGNMLASRSPRQSFFRRLLLTLLVPFTRLRKADHFKADIYLEGGDDLAAYGGEGRVLHLPGHSIGSLGFLTAEGNLFCGDLLNNNGQPALHIVDDAATAQASVERLKTLDIKTIYPGHGKPFSMEELRRVNL